MESSELVEALKTLGWSQGELARQLKVRPETVNRWVKGSKGKHQKIPGPATSAIRMWMEQAAQKKSEHPSEDAL